ncbi:MAG TPA: MFS transporter [Chloroflexia bacterium]|nr:MFS transporter [Chloroflexia bacterium]
MSVSTERAREPVQGESLVPGVSARLPGEMPVLATVALATMLAPLNSTMIAVALPHIVDEFHVGVDAAGWLVTSYLITMAAVQPIAGKLGDRLGRRRLIMGGLVAFGIASIGATLAPGIEVLLLFRLLQALSGAISLPNGVALLREIIPEARRASSFGMVGAATSLAASAGPPLGGFLLSSAGWRTLFFANVPVVVLALALGWYAIPRAAGPMRAREKAGNFDFLGALLLFTLLGGLAALLSLGRQSGTLLVPVTGSALLVGLFAFFIRHETKHSDPVIKLDLFRRRAFTSASSANALSNLTMYVMLLAIPLLLAGRPGWSSGQTGLVLAVLFGVVVFISPLGGRAADRFGRRKPVVAGLSTLALGVLPLAFAGSDITIPLLVGSLTLSGIGIGISGAGLQTSALDSVDVSEAGVAAGVYSTSRYFGSIVGSSLLAGLLGTPYTSAGFHAVFLMVAGSACFSVLLGLSLPSGRH